MQVPAPSRVPDPVQHAHPSVWGPVLPVGCRPARGRGLGVRKVPGGPYHCAQGRVASRGPAASRLGAPERGRRAPSPTLRSPGGRRTTRVRSASRPDAKLFLGPSSEWKAPEMGASPSVRPAGPTSAAQRGASPLADPYQLFGRLLLGFSKQPHDELSSS